MADGLSMRAYARYRKHRGLPGTSHVAVGKAIKDGRIAEAVGGDGLIDPDLADRLWAERTRPSAPPIEAQPKSSRPSDAPRSTDGGVAADPPSPAPAPDHSSAALYARARASLMAARAQQERLDLEERKGNILHADVHRRRVAELAGRFVRHLDSIPNAWPQRLATCGGDVEEIQIVLQDLVREMRRQITDGVEERVDRVG